MSPSLNLHGGQFLLSHETEDEVYKDQSLLPHPSEWVHRPLFLRPSTGRMGKSLKISDVHFDNKTGALPLGVPFEAESDLFQGKALMKIRGAESDNVSGDEAYFAHRSRHWQVVVQGRFKKELYVSDVMGKAEFDRPLKRLPPPFILRAAEKLLGLLSPGIVCDWTSDIPQIMVCIGSFPRTIRADVAGHEPDILTDTNLQEDCSAFGKHFAKKTNKVGKYKRKKLLSNPKNRYKFDTEHVYTFEYYDHLVNFPKCEMDLCGLARIGLATIHDGQPFTATVATIDGERLVSLELWHEQMFQNLVEVDNRN